MAKRGRKKIEKRVRKQISVRCPVGTDAELVQQAMGIAGVDVVSTFMYMATMRHAKELIAEDLGLTQVLKDAELAELVKETVAKYATGSN